MSDFGLSSNTLRASRSTGSGKSAVGRRALTGVYSGDSNYAQSPQSAAFPVQVVYKFIGFLTPLNGTGTYSGTSKLGNGLPIKWQLTNSSGTSFITMNNLNLSSAGLPNVLLEALFNGPASNGQCGLPSLSSNFAPLILFSPTTGAKGNSTFRYDTTSNQFIFNWDTGTGSNLGTGCYTLLLVLDDAVQQPPQVGTPSRATSVQLK